MNEQVICSECDGEGYLAVWRAPDDETRFLCERCGGTGFVERIPEPPATVDELIAAERMHWAHTPHA